MEQGNGLWNKKKGKNGTRRVCSMLEINLFFNYKVEVKSALK